MNRVIGVDAGIHGFLSILEDGIYAGSFEMPLKKSGTRNVIDAKKLRNLLLAFYPFKCVIERQFIIPSQGASSSAKTMFHFGLLVGIMYGMDSEIETVDAQKWQKHFFGKKVEDTKKSSIAHVLLWDNKIDLRRNKRCRVSDHNKSDSIMIARYGSDVIWEAKK